MCFSPSIPKDNSAQQAAAAEAARQNAVQTGVQNINSAFSGFNDPYFQTYQTDYQNNYLPQVQSQYDDARKNLILSLAHSGNLTSSSGAEQIGKLAGALGDQQAAVRSQAQQAADSLRNSVEAKRSNLLQLNSEAADPGSAASSAAQAAAGLTASPTYSPVGDLFASFLKPVAGGLAAEQQGYRGYNTGLFNQPNTASTRMVA